MQHDQPITEAHNESADQTPPADKQPLPQQPITSSWQSEMQYQPQQFPYQMPMMQMPQMSQMFGFNQFMKQQGQNDFYVRRSKEEQQLQNQQYQQMFDPQFNFPGFMSMLPMMPMMSPMPFFNYQNENYDQEQNQEDQQQEQAGKEQEEGKDKQEKYSRTQKYTKKQQYRPKYGRNYQGQQQQRDRPKQPQYQQQNKQRVRMDSDSFPALPAESKHFIYQKKGDQGESGEKKVSCQQEKAQEHIFTESKIFYNLTQIENIFKELKAADQIKIDENLSKLELNDLPIIMHEGCLQLENIEPSKITRRKEDQYIYYEKEKSKRKNTYDNSQVTSRHKFSLQITTYEKKEVK